MIGHSSRAYNNHNSKALVKTIDPHHEQELLTTVCTTQAKLVRLRQELNIVSILQLLFRFYTLNFLNKIIIQKYLNVVSNTK